MVQPIQSERLKGSTLEERLAYKFDDIQVAREDRDPELFDEIAKSIEILLKGVPEAYEELMAVKHELQKSLEAELNSIEEESSQATDIVMRDYVKNTKSYSARWEAREIYEEIIIEILQKNDLINIRSPRRSYLESVESSHLEPVAENPEEQLAPQEQQPESIPQAPEQQYRQQQQIEEVPQQQEEQYQSQPVQLPTKHPTEEQVKKLKKPYLHPKTKSFKDITEQPEQNFDV